MGRWLVRYLPLCMKQSLTCNNIGAECGRHRHSPGGPKLGRNHYQEGRGCGQAESEAQCVSCGQDWPHGFSDPVRPLPALCACDVRYLAVSHAVLDKTEQAAIPDACITRRSSCVFAPHHQERRAVIRVHLPAGCFCLKILESFLLLKTGLLEQQ
jgi:hypothetical protein